MQWGNLPVPGHLRGGAAVTAFFHHVCDRLCISRFERQFKIFADVSTLNFESTSWLVCSQISWPSCLIGCITPILLKICSTSLSLRSSIRNAISSCKSTESRSHSSLACKVGVFWSAIHELFSGITLCRHLGR